MHAHRSTTAKTVATIAAVGLIPFGLAVVSILPTADPPSTVRAADTVGTPGYVPAWLAIQTGTTSSITLNNGSGQVGAAQTLAPGADCGVVQGATASRFLTVEGTTRTNFTEGMASYQSGSVGVKEKKSGTSCYQVNAPTTEQLRLRLGPQVAGLVGSTAVASSAFLDLELKQSARILATLTLAGVTQASYELQSGATIGLPPLTSTTPFTCNNPADSGPDSGVNDNCRWPISTPSWTAGGDDGVFFDTITLKAVNGAFSLEGGGDGVVLPQSPTATPNASVIEIVEGTIDCGGQTRTEQASGDEPQVTVHRLGNVGSTTCVAVPYSLSNASRAAQFLKPLDSQTSAQFVWDLQWQFPQQAGSTALPELKIDFEVPAPGTTVTLGWCPDPAYDSAGQFLGYSGGLPASATDQEPDLDGVQFACVISRDAKTLDGSPDVIGSHDRVYVHGDAKTTW
jgi:hypothetical protein